MTLASNLLRVIFKKEDARLAAVEDDAAKMLPLHAQGMNPIRD
jgi:hypothetical protein